MIRVLHTGDLHLGSFPGPEANGENLRFLDICNCLDIMLTEAHQNRPDVAIIAGDIFHQARVWSDRGLKEQQTAVKFLRELAAICPVVAMRGTPNHDSEQQFLALANTFENDDRVRIVWEPCVLPVTTNAGEEISVACLPGFDRGFYRAKHPGLAPEEENEVFTKAIEDMIIGLKAQCVPGTPSVLVSHFTITGANMESGQTAFFGKFEPVVYPSTLAAADFDLVCFGHIHRPQRLEGCKSTFYCGAVSQLNFNDEGQERGYYIHEVPEHNEAGAFSSTFHPLPTRQHITIRLNDEDVARIVENGDMMDISPEALPDVNGKIVRVLYDCTDEHNKAFNHGTYENLLKAAGAFWVQEITPQKITITVDRRSMEADSTPEGNLTDYLSEKGFAPERIGELVELARPIIAEATEKATSERHTGLFVPEEIEVHNYRNYRDERFSYAPIRFATINGSNGVGKSSLFMDAMLDALFEEPREGDLTGWICNDPEARSGSIKFTFRLGDRLYRVTRTRQKSGKATLNIAEQVDGEWVNRSKEKFRDTQREIENIIGMDSLTLKACALIMQDQYGLFLQADKEARMNILGSILGLGIYAGMEELAADRATETNRAVRVLEEKATTITAGLPSREELAGHILFKQQTKQGYEQLIQQGTTVLDELKVKLNTQLEAAGRVMRLNSKITSMTAQKSTKENDRTTQKLILTAADATLADAPLIAEGMARYNALLEQEKDFIRRKAEYDNIAGKRQQVSGALALNKRTAADASAKASTITLTKIDPLLRVLDRATELAAKHAEYDETYHRITVLESTAPAYEEKRRELEAAEAQVKKIESDYGLKVAQLAARIGTLKEKVALLENSGCPDTERASCRFLADALKAKEDLPAAREEEAALWQEYQQAAQGAAQVVSTAREELGRILYSPEKIEALRRTLRELTPHEQQYQSIEARRSELETLRERVAELQKTADDALEAARKNEEELAALDAQLAAFSTFDRDYRDLKIELDAARQWPEREKKLPVAREQKTVAAQRILELTKEIEALDADITAARQELEEEQSRVTGTDVLKAQVAAQEAEIQTLKDAVQKLTMELGGLQKQVEDLDARMAEAQEIQEQVNAIAGKAAGYEELKKAFSQDGIPHNIIRSIIPIFEATATNILGQMSGGHMSVEFVTEKVLKSNAKKEVTTLDIIINDSDTGRLAYMSRSGGERVKAALSVILALAEIKSTKAGVQLGFLAVDEPPFLDSDGTQAYCTALETIQTRYPDTKILAISHDETFKARFPQSVTVYKDENGSHVTTD